MPRTGQIMPLPHKISYTNAVKGGESNLLFVRINPKYKDDDGLHAHEYEHVLQWYKMTFILAVLLLGASVIYSEQLLVAAPFIITVHGLAYTFIKDYRQYCEVRAFKEQLKHSPNDLDFFADYLATSYNLKLTTEEARKLLVN